LHGAMPLMLTRTSLRGDRRFEGRQYADSRRRRDRLMTDPDPRAAPTAAGTASAPKARAAAVDVFKAAPLGLVVWSNGSVLAEVRSVGRTGRSWAMIGSVEMRPGNMLQGVVPVGVVGWAGVQTEVVGERKED
jgi:hypothetical protein